MEKPVPDYREITKHHLGRLKLQDQIQLMLMAKEYTPMVLLFLGEFSYQLRFCAESKKNFFLFLYIRIHKSPSCFYQLNRYFSLHLRKCWQNSYLILEWLSIVT